MEITQQELELLARVSPGYVGICRADGEKLTALYFSPEIASLSGLSKEEYRRIAGEDAFRLVYEPDRENARREMLRHMGAREPFSGTYRTVLRKDTAWILTRGKCCGEQDGHPVYLIELVNISDETDIFRQILDRCGRMVYVSDRNTREMLYANKIARELREPALNSFAGRKCYEYIRGRTAPCPWCFLKKTKPGELYREERYFPEKGIWQQISGEYITWCGREAFVQYVDDVTREKQLREQLQRSQQMYRTAVEGAGIGVWEYDLSDRTMYCPDIYCRKYGLPQCMEFAPESTLEYFVAEDRPRLREMFRRLDAGEPSVTEEVWFQPRPDMAPVCCRGVFSTVRDEEGKPVRAYGVTQDVTAQKAEVQKYRSSLEELLHLNPNALCTFRLNLTKNLCGDGFGASTYVQDLIRGDTVDELCEHIASIIPDPEERQKFRDLFNRQKFLTLFENGKTEFSLSYRRSTETGQVHWVTTFVDMLRNPETGDVEAVAYSVDVQREKKEEEVITAITDKEYDYIALVDVGTRRISFRYASEKVRAPAAVRMEDYDTVARDIFSKEVAADELERCAADTAFDRVTEALEREEEYTYLFTCRDPAGQSYRKRLSYRYLNDSREEILLSRTDVTEAFRQEQERAEVLRKALLEAEHANSMKSEFLSNVSHDMRTPLNAVLGYARLARESANGPETEEYLDKIGKAGNILLSLINDTLDLSKIETGTVMLKPAPAPCDELVQKIINSVRPGMDAKHIRFTLDNSRAVMAIINVDALRVQEIFINLLSNAIKFTPEGGEITMVIECVGLKRDLIRDRITVRDNGCGISPEFLPKVFEPFAQERTEKTGNIGGSGLGLSIVKRLVELMGGTIEVKSRLGAGTEFVVCLDFQRADGGDGVSAPPLPVGGLAGKRVLLCEDNEMNTEIAKKLLELREVEVTCAANGEDGYKRFLASPPGTYDAVLMDIRMPVLNGYDAARRIRASGHPDARRIPIIAMSADAYDDDVKRSLSAGMNRHIAKPIDPEELYRALLSGGDSGK